jgi:hypothetical protein
MVFNLIVLGITALLAAFLLVWICCPWLRPWIESPKYRVLSWQSKYPEATRPPPTEPAPETTTKG